MQQFGDLASAAGGAGVFLGVLAFIKWMLGRHGDIVTELRKALDRGVVRESALCSACERLVDTIDQLISGMDDPPPWLVDQRMRVLQLLKDARERMLAKGGK